MDYETEAPPPYIHIERNEFSYRKHKKQKEEDINICNCQYNPNDPQSPCGDRCLNLLTSTECTPNYCPCGQFCKNQRFQKCEYAKVKLVKTEGRGWGLLADENIKAGQFIIEYCGEVISWKVAKRRSQAYESEGLKDAYIICLNADESIDATRKGSLARFINHSCQPNCETRKWNVLGEIRVGIFAKQDILSGAELSYNYNFEWFGGTMVRCLCGAASCTGFLGAKSRGFQEAAYVWEDDDERFSVENIPLYDSDDDKPSPSKSMVLSNWTSPVSENDVLESVEPLDSMPMDVDYMRNNEASKSSINNNNKRNFAQRKNSRGGRARNQARKQINVALIAERLSSKEAQEEILYHEGAKEEATAKLSSLYDEIRPVIEEHERENQEGSVPIDLAEKWIQASCVKYRADFDLYNTIIKNVVFAPKTSLGEKDMKYLENGS
ncbi:hypothetical protein LUZ60_004207 [Juncus effusus]|nr:hypothetical protein LUZ60_004207 [Juncus effusus]